MRLGPSDRNSWDVSEERVDLVRPVLPPHRCAFPAEPQDVVIDLNRTAAVVVDMQNDFCASGGWFHAKGNDIEPLRRPIPCLSTFLPELRRHGVSVIWVSWGNRPDLANVPPSVFHAGRPTGEGFGYGDKTPGGQDPILERDSWGAQIVADLAVAPEDLLVRKYRFSGFTDNELDSILRNRSITTLLFTGINTDRCVLATLMDASFLGYDCILVEDACSTPSPAYCTDAVMFLTRQLYGFTTTTTGVVEGLRLSRETSDDEGVVSSPAGNSG